jgi:hypothetical protein
MGEVSPHYAGGNILRIFQFRTFLQPHFLTKQWYSMKIKRQKGLNCSLSSRQMKKQKIVSPGSQK